MPSRWDGGESVIFLGPSGTSTPEANIGSGDAAPLLDTSGFGQRPPASPGRPFAR